MAAGEPKFSHITVTPDDEDDVVIQAGARPSRPVAEAPAQAPAPAPTDPSAGEAAAGRAVEEAVAPEPAEEGPAEDAGFQETTLDDLEPAPMPVAQKVVLALGAVGVIAVVAWYLFLR